ncbi:MAG: ATP-binding protein, partial [Cyanobacteriota bacterium]|nr:ATP-binding protein [Cyanobacteriota bacterium]
MAIISSKSQPSDPDSPKKRSSGCSEKTEKPSLLEPKETTEEKVNPKQDESIRPQRLSDYIGQKNLKEVLEIAIAAAQSRNEPLDHLLLYGPPGLGKTTMALILA